MSDKPKRLYLRVVYVYPDPRVNAPAPTYVDQYLIDLEAGGTIAENYGGAGGDYILTRKNGETIIVPRGWLARSTLKILATEVPLSVEPNLIAFPPQDGPADPPSS